MTASSETLQNVKVLITGADGFIGSHLTEMLLERGAIVTALAQYNSFNSWGWLEASGQHHNLTVVTGDIQDAALCRDLVQGHAIVFHLAALIAIPYSYRAVQSYVSTNVSGTMNICEAARLAGVQRLVHTSTSEVYGTARYVPIDEAHPLTPQSPYSASKIAADALAGSFYHAFNVPIVIARPFNTYGPRQSARAVIPTIISQLAAANYQVNLGDLSPTRDFNFVEDTCRGLIALATMTGGHGEVFNIGSNTEISVGDLALRIGALMNVPIELVRDEARFRSRSSEVFRLRCDNTKLTNASNWRPEVSLDEGLRRTIAWFSDPANLARYKAGLYNV
jgi:NAD dependent epimerase/dehydratase